ncbi:glycosyltransferase involved in cell wall biosynthesis [Desulfomicrobium macestii]|uniref:Glycosyltransferase involved in cell wall biosynthesis n=1 Tax=Desulfomicrobium macestii TaxID=90731 RepID=A0ABR9H6R1_9BACT|nr:glycosyltransferase family 4 protein [Desulfomicrobium macestii]MBE1426399.1 glycosyltransferase involved in cell wall biosynthesis [Desulfomicrobium macestii]
MRQRQGLEYWAGLSREHLPDNGHLRATGNLRREANEPHWAWLEERIASLCAEWPGEQVALLRGAAKGFAAIIREASGYDTMIAFGLNAAICAYLAGIPTAYFTYGGDIRVVLADAGGTDPVASALFRRILESPAFVIEAYGCDAEIHGVLKRNGLVRKSRYAFLPNINRPLFSRASGANRARRELGVPEDALVAFLPSRINYRWKGSDRFLEAFADVCLRFPELRLVVAGWGDDYAAARAFIEARGISSQVLIMDGAVSKPVLRDYMSAADLVVDQFVVGSLGSVSFEAMCLGKPVLTHLGNFNRFGYPSCPPVIQAESREEIVQALERACTDRAWLESRGRAAAKWYGEVYSEERLSRSVDLLAGPGPDAWLALVEEWGRGEREKTFPVPGSGSSFTVRRWPAPYVAGLAFANDCEYFSWEHFCELHRWLNNRGVETAFGAGLGLPVSDSLWFFNENEDGGFSLFHGTDHERYGEHADELRELVSLGILDTIHAYGGFDIRGGFTRAHAQAALRELEGVGVRMEVWSNHGNTNNRQNIGGLWPNPYQAGDLPGSPAYHADLLERAGVRFYWLDGFCTNKFCLGVRDGSGYRDDLACDDPDDVWGNRLLVHDTLRDGRRVLGFRRFRGLRPQAPDVRSLGRQLSESNLAHLEDLGGGIVVYQHMGCDRTAEGAAVCCATECFPDDAVEGMERLARRYHEGRIWVAPLSRFLAYQAMCEDLRIDTEPAGAGIRLVLSGARLDLRPKDCQGLSICMTGPDPVAEMVCLDGDGRRTRLSHEVRFGKDGLRTLVVPLEEFPDYPF